ncbi:MAG: pyridoxamine 5'-phosphate oxidase family protein [Pseudomonadota bacterium]
MPYGFMDIAITPSVRAAQAANDSAGLFENFEGDRAFDRFDERAAAFIAERDSFYMASVSETGWPYVQHRGGPKGFLKLLDERRVGFLDFRGNRQYISLGNLTADDRVALFLMDYTRRKRMKMYARASYHLLSDEPELAAALELDGYPGVAERAIVFTLEAYDWNCPQHITKRVDASEVKAQLSAYRTRIAQLEAENAELRERLA